MWTVRYGLHMLCNRREDRLLFDHQRTLADFFGYKDQDGALAVEQFMSKYYRIAKRCPSSTTCYCNTLTRSYSAMKKNKLLNR